MKFGAKLNHLKLIAETPLDRGRLVAIANRLQNGRYMLDAAAGTLTIQVAPLEAPEGGRGSYKTGRSGVNRPADGVAAGGPTFSSYSVNKCEKSRRTIT